MPRLWLTTPSDGAIVGLGTKGRGQMDDESTDGGEPDGGRESGSEGVNGRFARVPRVGIANVIRLLEVAQRSGSAPTVAQVANGLGQTMNSGAFRMRTAAAGLYGAVQSERGRLKITDRGRRLIDPGTRRDAAVEAYFAVEVFDRLYREYEGVNLPTSTGIEGDLLRYGVNPRQLPEVRRVLMATAEIAGMFEVNSKRLTIPPSSRASVGAGQESDRGSIIGPAAEGADAGEPRGVNAVPVPTVHCLVARLVEQLPPIDGQADVRQLQRWLDAAKVTLELLYEVDLVAPHQ